MILYYTGSEAVYNPTWPGLETCWLSKCKTDFFGRHDWVPNS